VQWSLGSTAAGLRLRKKRSGERGPGKLERGRANQRVSRVADGKAELTEATDGARARRRSQNGRQSTVGGGRVLWSRAQSEGEGERVWLRVQVSGGRWASGAWGSKGARTCRGGRRSCGHGRVHDGGSWAGGWGRADKWGRRDRERESGARARGTTATNLAHGAAREREGERARGLAPTSGTRLSGTKGKRARARRGGGLGLMGRLGLN
jgi:hypothetical protein